MATASVISDAVSVDVNDGIHALAGSGQSDEDVTVVPETPLQSESEDEEGAVDILRVGVSFVYRIPRFPVVTINLRQITFQAVLTDRTTVTYHGFIQDDHNLEGRDYPASICVKEYCFVEVEEFCKGAPAHHLNHPEEGVYLVWTWNWITQPCSESLASRRPDNADVHHSGSDTDDEDDEPILHTDEPILHTVRFKCIGATRDRQQQHALEWANELQHAGQEVKVALFPERTNPVDAKAIAFKCLLDDQQWHRIGYVVREALDEVHEVLALKDITDVKCGWIKYRIDLQRSGPGFYAGIDITRKGCWSSLVCQCASPK